jgi:hypothetical protein
MSPPWLYGTPPFSFFGMGSVEKTGWFHSILKTAKKQLSFYDD